MPAGARPSVSRALLCGSFVKQALRAVFTRRRLRDLGLAVAWVLLVAPAVQAGIPNLSWDAPTSNADSTSLTDLSGYRVYSGLLSLATCPPSSPAQFVPSSSSAPPPGTVVNFELTGLTEGTTYFIRVAAVDFSGNESACSNEVSALALPDGQVPISV